ncbi:hypothetical protein PMSD_24715 [Paenibacillus macquariensis subsp. defensor]|nr:hypothetical protein PMSD_24715 [Paenibacillus macquariensis subsp. defensor]
MIVKSNLMIPIRTLSSLGLSYSWDTPSQLATIKNKDGNVLKITVKSRIAYKDGVSSEMPVSVLSKDGRVLVPIRFITENLGYQVQYESIRKMVFITSKDYKINMNVFDQGDLEAARKVAISLPLIANFKTLVFSTFKYHSYRFPNGKANTYMFSDSYTHTIVEIKDGKAYVSAQYVEGDRSNFAYKAGNISGTNTAEPVFEPFILNPVYFSLNQKDLTTSSTSYFEGEEYKQSVSSIKVYSDIIQKIPNNH